MLLMVYHQDSWQQLDFVTEQTKRNRAGQKRRVHEYTLAEGDIERDSARFP